MKPIFKTGIGSGRTIVEQDIFTRIPAGMSLESFNTEMERRDRTDRLWLIAGIVVGSIGFAACIVWGVLA